VRQQAQAYIRGNRVCLACSWRKDQPGVGACAAREAWGGRGQPRLCTATPRGAGGSPPAVVPHAGMAGRAVQSMVRAGQAPARHAHRLGVSGGWHTGGCVQALPVLDSAKHPGVPSRGCCCAAHAAWQVSALVFYEPLAAWHHAAFARFPGVRPSAAASAASLMCVPEASL